MVGTGFVESPERIGDIADEPVNWQDRLSVRIDAIATGRTGHPYQDRHRPFDCGWDRGRLLVGNPRHPIVGFAETGRSSCRCRRTRRSRKSTYGKGDPEHALSGRTDHERRSLWPRDPEGDLTVVETGVGAIEGEFGFSKQSADDRERLLEPVDPVVVGKSERRVFILVPTSPESKNEAAVGDIVDRHRFLGDDGGVMERRAGNQVPKLDPGGHRGQRSQQGP